MKWKNNKQAIGLTVMAILLIAGLISLAVYYWPVGKLEPGQQRVLKGPKGNELLGPLAVTVDPKGNLYIADSGHGKIITLDGKGRLQSQFPLDKGANGQTAYPSAETMDAKGNLYVADPILGIVTCLSQGRTFIRALPLEEDKSVIGSWRPLALTCDPEGNLFVAEGEKQRIMIFSPEGKFLGSFGEAGQGPGQFAYPNGLAWDNVEQCLWVADSNNGRIQVLSRDGKVLKIIDRGPGGETFYPRGLVYDEEKGIVYFSDPLGQQVYKYQIDKNELTPLNGEWRRPGGLSLQKGLLAVADRGSNQIVLIGIGTQE